MSEYTRTAIYIDAMRASKMSQTILEACPYPWFTDEGKWWRECFRKAEASKEAA